MSEDFESEDCLGLGPQLAGDRGMSEFDLSQHTRGAYDTPQEPCPYCGDKCDADWCDVGVGMVQCGPYHCENCGASEIGPNDKDRILTEPEKKFGWYAPGAEPGSSANVIGGKIVTHHEAKDAYQARFFGPDGNADWATPGVVDEWWDEQRKPK